MWRQSVGAGMTLGLKREKVLLFFILLLLARELTVTCRSFGRYLEIPKFLCVPWKKKCTMGT